MRQQELSRLAGSSAGVEPARVLRGLRSLTARHVPWKDHLGEIHLPSCVWMSILYLWGLHPDAVLAVGSPRLQSLGCARTWRLRFAR